MTKDEVIEKIVNALRDEFDDAEVEVGRIADEPTIGLDVDGDTWFIEVQAG